MLIFQVLATNNHLCCHEENILSLNDIISTSGEKYKVSERKIGQVANPNSFFGQSLPPNCPINDETIGCQKEFSHSHSYPSQLMTQFSGTNSSYEGVLRKRSNENKNSNSVSVDLVNNKTRSKSYMY